MFSQIHCIKFYVEAGKIKCQHEGQGSYPQSPYTIGAATYNPSTGEDIPVNRVFLECGKLARLYRIV